MVEIREGRLSFQGGILQDGCDGWLKRPAAVLGLLWQAFKVASLTGSLPFSNLVEV